MTEKKIPVGGMVFKIIIISFFIFNPLIINNTFAEITVREEDHNKDGKIDTWTYYDDGKEVRVELDINGDSKVDSWVWLKDKKKIKSECDFNGDGKVDFWAYSDDSKTYLSKFDRNYDGKIDSIEYYDNLDKFNISDWSRQEIDTDLDGNMDVWNEKEDNGIIVAKVDRNKDRRIDKKLYFKDENSQLRIQPYKVCFDNDADGVFDFFMYYANGDIIRIEKDNNNDGKIDTVISNKFLLYFMNLAENFRINRLKKKLGIFVYK